MPLFSGSRRIRGISHFAAISHILIKHGLGELSERLFGRRRAGAKSGLPDAARIRRVFEELGPSFIKLGQLMSTRGDILPPEYIEELTKLQDRVPPVPFDEIRRTIELELQQPLEVLFAHFEPHAMAAASVAQVHAARLKSGERVAVKVIRPGIDKRIRKDIDLMYFFAAQNREALRAGPGGRRRQSGQGVRTHHLPRTGHARRGRQHRALCPKLRGHRRDLYPQGILDPYQPDRSW